MRARNAGSRLGSAPWVMFLDDDVVLGPGCISMLLDELQPASRICRPRRGLPGRSGRPVDDSSRSTKSGVLPTTAHVAMGATLFRRDALAHLSFRWQPGRCECQCCCDDLRRIGTRDRLPARRPGRLTNGADSRGHHSSPEPAPARARRRARRADRSSTPEPRILTTFDRRHLNRFLLQFLPTLRESGNDEIVTAVAYGLWPSERQRLAAIPGVEPVFLANDGDCPCDPPAPRFPGRRRTMARRDARGALGRRATSSSRAPSSRSGTLVRGSSRSAPRRPRTLRLSGESGRLGVDALDPRSIGPQVRVRPPLDAAIPQRRVRGRHRPGDARLSSRGRPAAPLSGALRDLRLGRSDDPQSLLPLAAGAMEGDPGDLELHDLPARSAANTG